MARIAALLALEGERIGVESTSVLMEARKPGRGSIRL